MINIDPFTLHALTGAVLPILLGFILRQRWTTKVKQILTMVISTISSFLLDAVNESGHALFSLRSVAMAVVQLVIAIAMYVGFYERTVDPNRLPNVVPVPEPLDVKLSKAA